MTWGQRMNFPEKVFFSLNNVLSWFFESGASEWVLLIELLVAVMACLAAVVVLILITFEKHG